MLLVLGPRLLRLEEILDSRLAKGGAFVVVALFTLTLGDYLILAQLGVRLLPLDYETLEVAFFVLAALTVLVGFLVYRRRGEVREGLFRSEIAGHRIVFAFCVFPMAATVVGFFGPISWLVDLFANFRLQYAATLLVGAAALVMFRQVRWAAIVLGFMVVNLGAALPHLVKLPTAGAGGGSELRFVLANVNAMNRNHEALLSFVDEADPDVIVLQEVNQRWVEAAGSLGDEYPYSVVEAQEGYFGIGLWSRLPIVSGAAEYFLKERIPAIVATLEGPEGEILLVATHAMPPRNAYFAELRAQQLEAMSELAQRTSSEVVVLADLNATPWSHTFRSFVRSSGLKDASRGQGLQWTWPARIWPLMLPIDHALVSERVRVVDLWTGPPIGSDHYPLVLDAGF